MQDFTGNFIDFKRNTGWYVESAVTTALSHNHIIRIQSYDETYSIFMYLYLSKYLLFVEYQITILLFLYLCKLLNFKNYFWDVLFRQLI